MPGDQKRTLSWKTKKEKEVCAFLVHHLDKPVDTDSIIEEYNFETPVTKCHQVVRTRGSCTPNSNERCEYFGA
ncbi:hypothetical protein BABA_19331 [Neobacillus bataviensis LMG 21833]|uniref:Uncharacterized protein n=1 Tax=Neobacillus bataviensis LMG 21833 TaxID=1117379 RepID=K6CZG2_9BACI|nr:hypothetical protein [Neobacillus bataviensis]EKN65617.1 hypothetical protein BABA_19331 [Neobacillus bataviensis LMG 21833]